MTARSTKRQREQAKVARDVARQARRSERKEEEASTETEAPGRPAEAVLEELAKLHEQFDAEQIDFDTFDERKSILLAELAI